MAVSLLEDAITTTAAAVYLHFIFGKNYADMRY